MTALSSVIEGYHDMKSWIVSHLSLTVLLISTLAQSIMLRNTVGSFRAPAFINRVHRSTHLKVIGKLYISSSSSSSNVAAKALTTSTSLENPITSRATDYTQWYTDVVSASGMIDNSPVRGCMVIKPWGMSVWNHLQRRLDANITASGAENAYFPLLIPANFLAKEAEHVEGFAKECAVVTHRRLKSTTCLSTGKPVMVPDEEAELEEPLIIRPTSETMIWHMFGKWIHSHRDLPLKINQWANVMRWEMRTRPFLRTSEFLWQEGHTAHGTQEDALKTTKDMLELYHTVCEDMLALPTIKGVKSPSERFAGAVDTYTIEGLMQNGWALQCGTSHFLGQNFAKAFDVRFQSAAGQRELVWATSWGVSTRLIGAMIMSHSDDKGLVLPPQVAPHQVVIVPILKGTAKHKTSDEVVLARAEELLKALQSIGIRAHVDDRSYMRPGAKYFEWERKGVPLRLELGNREVESDSAVLVPRISISTTADSSGISGVSSSSRSSGSINQVSKQVLNTSSLATFGTSISMNLQSIHDALLSRARSRLETNIYKVSTYSEMLSKLVGTTTDSSSSNSSVSQLLEREDEEEAKLPSSSSSSVGLFLVPWKCDTKNEAAIKAECKATIRCYPFDHNVSPPQQGVKCFYSGEQATHMALFGRAF